MKQRTDSLTGVLEDAPIYKSEYARKRVSSKPVKHLIAQYSRVSRLRIFSKGNRRKIFDRLYSNLLIQIIVWRFWESAPYILFYMSATARQGLYEAPACAYCAYFGNHGIGANKRTRFWRIQ